MTSAKEIDFQPHFNDEEAEEYASEVLQVVVDQYDFERVSDTDFYVKRPNLFARYIPGNTHFSMSVEGTRLRYNPELVDEEDLENAVDERLEEARQDFISWKGVRDNLDSQLVLPLRLQFLHLQNHRVAIP